MSGLIYAAIVVMWAAFLVPMWLRRHDAAAEAKSVDRFATAMKVLARRTSTLDADSGPAAAPPVRDNAGAGPGRVKRWAVQLLPAARRAVERQARLPRAGRVGARNDGRAVVATLDARSGRGARRPVPLAVRRQRVLAALVLLTVVVGILGAAAVVPWAAVAPAPVLLVGYVVHLRVQARRTVELARRRALARGGVAVDRPDLRSTYTVKVTPAPTRRGDRPATSTSSNSAAGSAGRRAAGSGSTAATAPASPSSAAAGTARADSAPVASSAEIPDGFAGPRVSWDPVPVPAPTYVSAPRAPRAVRSIDLSTDGAWTSGRLVADAKAAAAAALAGPAGSTAADDEPAEARRAVGD